MNGNCYFSEGLNPALTCNKNEGNRVAIPVEDIETRHLYNQRGVVHDVNGISRTLIGSNQGTGSGNEPKVAIPVLTPERAVKRQNGRRFKQDGEESFTLTSQDRHGVAVNVSGFNATLKEGGGMTQTALALTARDYKGMSGSHQMMTGACLLLTRESAEQNVKSQTASVQERTGEFQTENRKEH